MARKQRERVGAAGAAALLGIKRTSWNSLVAKRKAPAPDGREEISDHPWWYVASVCAYRDGRPGRGFRGDLQ